MTNELIAASPPKYHPKPGRVLVGPEGPNPATRPHPRSGLQASAASMFSWLGASASMWDGLFVAHVADGDPTKAFTWRRLSDSTNAFSASSQATYCPPIAAGQAYWRSGRN